MKDIKLHSYRPIIIQSTLRDVGTIIWLDIDYRLVQSDLTSWLHQADTSGVVSWPELEPAAGQNTAVTTGHTPAVATTALTHPKMFGFFNKKKYEDYAFQHMVGLSCLILHNNEKVKEQLMLPWLQCVLTEVSI